jgi:protein ImuA
MDFAQPWPTGPTALAVARNRAAVMAELRRLMPRMGEQRKRLPFGLGTIDSHLPDGGLACGALHEIVPAAESCIAAAFGFIAAVLGRVSSMNNGAARTACSPPPCGEGLGVGVGRFCKNVDAFASPHDPHPTLPTRGREQQARLPRTPPLVFVMPAHGLRPYRSHGRLHGHGLNALGLDPARLILVETAHRKETLWAMEEAVRSAAPAAVVGVIDTLDLKLSQRLHLAATDAGLPLFLLRPAPTLESSAAATRWRVGTAAATRDRFGLVTRPRWHLQLERCRNGRPGEWVVEYDHVAHRFSLAAALADFSRARGAGETSIRQAS